MLSLKNMKLSTRLSLGFGVVIVLFTIACLSSLVRLHDFNNTVEKLALGQVPKLIAAESWLTSLQQSARLMRETLILEDEKEIKLAMENAQAGIRERQELAEQLKNSVIDAEEKRLFEAVMKARQNYKPLEDAFLQAIAISDFNAAKEILMLRMRQPQAVYIDGLKAFNRYHIEESSTEAQEANAKYKTTLMLIAFLSIAAILSGIAAAYFIISRLTRQLGGEPDYVIGVVKSIADGNLSTAVQLKARHGNSLLGGIKQMQENLQQTITQVQTASHTIARASHEIASGNSDLSGRTESQASSLQETVASMEELTSTVKQNAEHAKDANSLACSASDIAKKGGEVVTQVVQTMGEINHSSHKIVDIISVIDDIAFQTNILALNAAVEAARAGEQGRGFAVVAGEVRSLAQRCASAAREIKALIGTSVEKVEVGSKLVDQAGTTMGEVVASVQRVAEIIAAISRASEEQTNGIQQINASLSTMDNVTQQNAALVEQAASAAESLKEQADKLTEAVSVFRINASEPALQLKGTAAVAEVMPLRAGSARGRRLALR